MLLRCKRLWVHENVCNNQFSFFLPQLTIVREFGKVQVVYLKGHDRAPVVWVPLSGYTMSNREEIFISLTFAIALVS